MSYVDSGANGVFGSGDVDVSVDVGSGSGRTITAILAVQDISDDVTELAVELDPDGTPEAFTAIGTIQTFSFDGTDYVFQAFRLNPTATGTQTIRGSIGTGTDQSKAMAVHVWDTLASGAQEAGPVVETVNSDPSPQDTISAAITTVAANALIVGMLVTDENTDGVDDWTSDNLDNVRAQATASGQVSVAIGEMVLASAGEQTIDYDYEPGGTPTDFGGAGLILLSFAPAASTTPVSQTAQCSSEHTASVDQTEGAAAEHLAAVPQDRVVPAEHLMGVAATIEGSAEHLAVLSQVAQIAAEHVLAVSQTEQIAAEHLLTETFTWELAAEHLAGVLQTELGSSEHVAAVEAVVVVPAEHEAAAGLVSQQLVGPAEHLAGIEDLLVARAEHVAQVEAALAASAEHLLALAATQTGVSEHLLGLEQTIVPVSEHLAAVVQTVTGSGEHVFTGILIVPAGTMIMPRTGHPRILGRQ